MELPSHYFPVHLCPHMGENKNHRLMFADHGSHKNVNITVDDEGGSLDIWPQTAQKSVENLTETLHLLPLFDHPCNDIKEWDQILGMSSFDDILHHLVYVARLFPRVKGFIKRNPKCLYAKQFEAIKAQLKKLDEQQAVDAQDMLNLKHSMGKGLHMLCDKLIKLKEVHNFSHNCLKGFSRDFSGGLITVLENTANVPERLVHAGGPSLKDIYMSEISQGSADDLKQGKVTSKLSVDHPVFELVSSPKDADNSMICARQKHQCLYLSHSSTENKLQVQDCLDLENEIVSSVNFSPYLKNEVLVSTADGTVYLWDVSTSSHRTLFHKDARFECPDRWSSSYFGGHPRQVVVADNTSVEMFDHRSHFRNAVELFALSYQLIKKEERVMAAASLGFPYHVIATDYSVFVTDQRFSSTPVLQWSSEFVSAPQYLKVLHGQKLNSGEGKLIFLASQQPAEVMCFSVNVSTNRPPTSPVLPWKLSSFSDIYQASSSFHCDMQKVEKRFKTSLAGVAVSNQATGDGYTVYQMDAYGDVFYQSFRHEKHKDSDQLLCCTASQRQKAQERSSTWLKAFDTQTWKSRGKAVESELHVPVVSLGSFAELLKDVPTDPDPFTADKEGGTFPISPTSKRPVLHRKLKNLEKLPQKGSNSQLHLALKENKDIKEILQQREEDHMAMRKKLREKNKKLAEKKRPPPDNFKSKSFINSSSSSSDDDDDNNDDLDDSSNKTRQTEPARKGLRSASKQPESLGTEEVSWKTKGDDRVADSVGAYVKRTDSQHVRTGPMVRMTRSRSKALLTASTSEKTSAEPDTVRQITAITDSVTPQHQNRLMAEKEDTAESSPDDMVTDMVPPEAQTTPDSVTEITTDISLDESQAQADSAQLSDQASLSSLSDRLPSRFTTSEAVHTDDDTTSLSSSSSALPFSINQNALRRAFSKRFGKSETENCATTSSVIAGNNLESGHVTGTLGQVSEKGPVDDYLETENKVKEPADLSKMNLTGARTAVKRKMADRSAKQLKHTSKSSVAQRPPYSRSKRARLKSPGSSSQPSRTNLYSQVDTKTGKESSIKVSPAALLESDISPQILPIASHTHFLSSPVPPTSSNRQQVSELCIMSDTVEESPVPSSISALPHIVKVLLSPNTPSPQAVSQPHLTAFGEPRMSVTSCGLKESSAVGLTGIRPRSSTHWGDESQIDTTTITQPTDQNPILFSSLEGADSQDRYVSRIVESEHSPSPPNSEFAPTCDIENVPSSYVSNQCETETVSALSSHDHKVKPTSPSCDFKSTDSPSPSQKKALPTSSLKDSEFAPSSTIKPLKTGQSEALHSMNSTTASQSHSHRSMLSWISRSLGAQSEAVAKSPIIPATTLQSPQHRALARRKLVFGNVSNDKDIPQHRLKPVVYIDDSDDSSRSDGNEDEEPTASPLLPCLRKNIDLTNPAVRRIMDPSLAGFLSSPNYIRKSASIDNRKSKGTSSAVKASGALDNSTHKPSTSHSVVNRDHSGVKQKSVKNTDENGSKINLRTHRIKIQKGNKKK